jgi:hypothetical protein
MPAWNGLGDSRWSDRVGRCHAGICEKAVGAGMERQSIRGVILSA